MNNIMQYSHIDSTCDHYSELVSVHLHELLH